MYDERKTSRVAGFGVAVGLVSLLALAAAGPLHRLGVVGLAGAFSVLKWALYGTIATLVLPVIVPLLTVTVSDATVLGAAYKPAPSTTPLAADHVKFAGTTFPNWSFAVATNCC